MPIVAPAAGVPVPRRDTAASSLAPSPAMELDQLTALLSGPGYALARRVLLDDQLAEDVVQEVLLAVWRDPGAYDPTRGSVRSWVLAAVHHRAVDAVRREESRRRRQELDAGLRAPLDLGDDPAERPHRHAEYARLAVALRGLPEAQREVLVLAYYGGCTQQQIAAHTGAPLGTVKTRMRTGMQALQRALAAPV